MRYSIWRACERIGIKPEPIKDNFEENNLWIQSSIIAYNHIRQHEEDQILTAFASIPRLF